MLHVSPTLALRVDIGLGIFGLLLAASAIWAIVLGIRKDWSRARSVAVWTFWLSAGVQVLAWFAVPIAVVNHAVNVAPDGEVSSKARVLAESISEGMNLTAPLLLATPAAISVWVLAVWRARKTATRAAPAPR
jgi:hypothetical protein